MRRYILTGHDLPKLKLVQSEDPRPGYGEIVVDLRAASLNYRDLIMAQRFSDVVPLSDGAGVVSAMGDGVEGHAIGDRVVIAFMPKWLDGEFTDARRASLGGSGFDGVLTERIVVPATGVVRIPDAMTFEAAATLPCAGVTAWSALFERRPVQPGETVLLLGTGGVSIFALQLAKMAGARVIITSSSDEKLERARALGADHLINYRSVPDWENEVLRLTDGVGTDLAVDVAGPATLNKTLKATRLGGRISLMGVLTGFEGPIDTAIILEKRITLQGIYVGPVAALQALVKTNIAPQIDRVFPFEDAEAAYDALRAAEHFGKLVIWIGEQQPDAQT
ncbi:zinc-dependent alcohol dehydrogenase family protein [Gluconobacter thailandicus]|uniref:NAD(P)-dependent alcohol dehydrogenase n=1 Tax=Gluconobacter thailandicus TaxID=257438 RepID=A0AAP9EP34_GLUTH|nr:NAD(P)-dependent alcohol dehydrogenase [Gluconobacter thailandicus]QEH94928.1 NAD(P)-dependent alcohol dehydrogenase [Gluconobacter thailandicus]